MTWAFIIYVGFIVAGYPSQDICDEARRALSGVTKSQCFQIPGGPGVYGTVAR